MHVRCCHVMCMYCAYTCTFAQVTALKEGAGRLGMSWCCHWKVAIAYRCSYIFCECKLFFKQSTNIRKAHFSNYRQMLTHT